LDPETQIFISHSYKDHNFAERLANDIEKAGFKVWYSEWEMKPGDSLTKKVAEGIHSSGYVIVVLSPDSVKSAWVEKELSLALYNYLKKGNIKVIPVVYKSCNYRSTFQALGDVFYADFRKSYNYGLLNLMKGIGLPSERCGIQLYNGNIEKLRVLPEICDNRENLRAYNIASYLEQVSTNWHFHPEKEMITLHLQIKKEKNIESPPLLEIPLTKYESSVIGTVTSEKGWAYYDLLHRLSGFTSIIQIAFLSNGPKMYDCLFWLVDEKKREFLRSACDDFMLATCGDLSLLFNANYKYPSKDIIKLRKVSKNRRKRKDRNTSK
jgi:hypothetical protein